MTFPGGGTAHHVPPGMTPEREERPAMSLETPSCGGRFRAATTSFEEPRPQCLLQLTDAGTDGRLHNIQALGSPLEISSFHHVEEGDQKGDIHFSYR